MSSRYGERGYGRYGDPEDDRTEDRYSERDADRGRVAEGGRHERGGDYGMTRRGGYSNLRRGGYGGGFEREYGQERDPGSRDLGARDYGSREYGGGDYGARYGREVFERGGYASPARRHEGEDYGRSPGARVYGRNYTRERAYVRGGDDDEVRDYDTDYGRTTSRFYGRSGYEYGRDDYDDDRGERGRVEYGRRDERGHGDEREGGSWLDRAADQVRSWFGGDDDDPEGREDDPRRAYARGRGEGKFRGRGPKNYRRSDDRLREEVCDRLTDNEWLDASDVDVNVVAGEVILTGMVDSRYAKRLAENIAESVSGVSNVQNNLRVQSYQQAGTEAPLAGLDAPLPAASTATTPASDITATTGTTDTNDADDFGRPSSSRAAGQG